MVRPLYRSRSYKRVYRRTPGGETVIHFEKRKNTPMRCGRCGAMLPGVPIKDSERRKLPKTAKRPERMFGGVLCSRCLRIVLKRVIRNTFSSQVVR
ncbi:MAG: 50S ribosomal protein L34e [Ignisphaera sp.]